MVIKLCATEGEEGLFCGVLLLAIQVEHANLRVSSDQVNSEELTQPRSRYLPKKTEKKYLLLLLRNNL